MGFNDTELSTHGPSDIRLYRFVRGTKEWLYTNIDLDVTVDGKTYVALPIEDDGIKQKPEVTSDDLSVTVLSSIPLVTMFRGTPPYDLIGLEIRSMQYEDTEALLIWRGFVSSIKYINEASSVILCNTITPSLTRKGLRMAYERACPHALYDAGCTLSPADWREDVIVLSIAPTTFTFGFLNPELAASRWAGRFTNGFCEWSVDPAYKERRGILSHNGTTVQVLGQTDTLTRNAVVSLYPGCQRIPQNCILFNNIANYGGFPFMPGRSPFDGEPIFS